MSIAGGFFGRLADNMGNKREFIRNRVEEDRMYLKQQGMQRMAQVQEQRTAYESAARSLISRGADEASVLTALEADPQGLLSVYREVDRNKVYNPAAINSIFDISNEYRTESTMDEILQRVIPAVTALPDDADPTEVKRRSLASWLGLDTEEALNEQVYNQQIVGGMTGDQILASMNIPVNARGDDNSNVNFDFTGLDSAEELTSGQVSDWFSRSLEEYEPLLVEYEAGLLAKAESIAADDSLSAAERQAALQEIKEQQDAVSDLPREKQSRLEGLIGILGIQPNTKTYFDQHPELFSTRYGFDAGIADLFSAYGQEDTTEEAIPGGGEIITTDLPPPDDGSTPPPEPEAFQLEATDSKDAVLKAEQWFENNDGDSVVVSIGGVLVTIDRPNKVDLSGMQGVGAADAWSNSGERSRGFTPRVPEESEPEAGMRPRTRPGNLESANQAVELAESMGSARVEGLVKNIISDNNTDRRNTKISRAIGQIGQMNDSPEKARLITALDRLRR